MDFFQLYLKIILKSQSWIGTKGDKVNVKLPNAEFEAFRKSFKIQESVLFNKLPYRLKLDSPVLFGTK